MGGAYSKSEGWSSETVFFSQTRIQIVLRLHEGHSGFRSRSQTTFSHAIRHVYTSTRSRIRIQIWITIHTGEVVWVWIWIQFASVVNATNLDWELDQNPRVNGAIDCDSDSNLDSGSGTHVCRRDIRESSPHSVGKQKSLALSPPLPTYLLCFSRCSKLVCEVLSFLGTERRHASLVWVAMLCADISTCMPRAFEHMYEGSSPDSTWICLQSERPQPGLYPGLTQLVDWNLVWDRPCCGYLDTC